MTIFQIVVSICLFITLEAEAKHLQDRRGTEKSFSLRSFGIPGLPKGLPKLPKNIPGVPDDIPPEVIIAIAAAVLGIPPGILTEIVQERASQG